VEITNIEMMLIYPCLAKGSDEHNACRHRQRGMDRRIVCKESFVHGESAMNPKPAMHDHTLVQN